MQYIDKHEKYWKTRTTSTNVKHMDKHEPYWKTQTIPTTMKHDNKHMHVTQPQMYITPANVLKSYLIYTR
jgi:hypothetical protein